METWAHSAQVATRHVPSSPRPAARLARPARGGLKDGCTVPLAVAVLQQRKLRVARRFREERRKHGAEAELDWTALSESMSRQFQGLEEEDAKEITYYEGRGWGSFRPSQISGKLNAELANGRLALISSRGERVKTRAVPAEAAEEEDPALQRKKFDLKQLPSDEGYGWDPEQVEEAKPFDPRDQVGVTEPLGYFDPLGFAKMGDPEAFRFKRAAELKHGRVAMLASLGLVVQHYVRLPGFERAGSDWASQFNTIISIPALYQFSILPIVVIFLELSIWAQEEDKEPGNFGDPLGLGMYDTEMRNRELNNGRFAMFAAVGIIAAQSFTGKDAIEQFGL